MNPLQLDPAPAQKRCRAGCPCAELSLADPFLASNVSRSKSKQIARSASRCQDHRYPTRSQRRLQAASWQCKMRQMRCHGMCKFNGYAGAWFSGKCATFTPNTPACHVEPVARLATKTGQRGTDQFGSKGSKVLCCESGKGVTQNHWLLRFQRKSITLASRSPCWHRCRSPCCSLGLASALLDLVAPEGTPVKLTELWGSALSVRVKSLMKAFASKSGLQVQPLRAVENQTSP